MKDKPKYKEIDGNQIIAIVDSSHDPIADCVLYHCIKMKNKEQTEGGIFYLYQDKLDNLYAEVL